MTIATFSQSCFPEIYDTRIVPPIFVPWVEMILDMTDPQPGERLLDIACGTGVVARRARTRMGDQGRVVGVDISVEMLVVARAADQRVDWRQGDAMDLPLTEDEAFEVVICHQGLQFFPDRRKGAAEMRRALVPGGRLAVAVWGPDIEVPLPHELRKVAESHLGPIVDRRHSFGGVGALDALVRDAGFHRVEARAMSLPVRFADGAEFARLNALALAGMTPAWTGTGATERERVMAAILAGSAPILTAHSEAAGLAWNMPSNIVTAEA